MILATARQPLRLDQLANVLAVRKGTNDHSDTRTPPMRLIKELCSSFVTVDRETIEDSADLPLKFFHRSVYDFFTEDPESIGVPKHLWKYFVRQEQANLEMGEMCLAYLSYLRYPQVADLSEITESISGNQHAFLKYAATFWFQHLHLGEHSRELFEQVCRFVQSSNFWTCVVVQSKIVPYLFSPYSQSSRNAFRLGVCEYSKSDEEDKKNYADPLPQWLDQYGLEGHLIVQCLQAFIKEWNSTLTRFPEAIDQSMIEPTAMRAFPARASQQSRRVRRFNSQTGSAQRSRKEALLFSKVRDAIEELNVVVHSQVSAKRSGVLEAHMTKPIIPGTSHEWRHDRDISNKWTLDLRTLNLKSKQDEKEEDHAAPRQISSITNDLKQARDEWTVATTHFHLNMACEGVSVVHCLLTQRGESNRQEGSSDSGYGSADSDDSSDDSDSDSESEAESEAESEPEVQEIKPSAMAKGVPHCLILFPKHGKPIWSLTSIPIGKRRDCSPSIHPSKSIAVWSESAHEIKIGDLTTGSVKTGVLPEPADAQLGSAAVAHKGTIPSPVP